MQRAGLSQRIGWTVFTVFAVWCAGVALCRAQDRPHYSQEPRTGEPSRTAVVAPFSWRVLAGSGEGRPLEYAQFGQGRRHILVIGPLAGDQPAALGMIDKLAEYLAASRAPLPDVTLTLLRDPNPDGRVRRTRFNARGVDLDRNFSTSNWQRIPEGNHWRSGLRPHSEAETRVLAALLADLRPERVVALSASSERAVLAWFGPGADAGRSLAEDLELPLAEAAPQPGGSLVAYAADDRGVPVVAFGVPAGAATLDNWSAYGRGLLTAAGLASPEPRRLPVADLAPEPMPGSDNSAPAPFSPRMPRGQGPLRQFANGPTKATPASEGRPESPAPVAIQPESPAREPAAGGFAPGSVAPPRAAAPAPGNSARDVANSMDIGGWRPSTRSPATSPADRPQAAAPATLPATDATYWPADRIQRLPPADRVDR